MNDISNLTSAALLLALVSMGCSEELVGPDSENIDADYAIVDTGQEDCFDSFAGIPCPPEGQSHFGQDAQYEGLQPSYQDNGDGTVTDLNTGLMWEQGFHFLEWADAPADAVPFIDTDSFDFEYGSTGRYIDAQYVTSTAYTGYVFGDQLAFFGVNFADGRIKGYPQAGNPEHPEWYARWVRGSEGYGENDFVENGVGTVTDESTGLMWCRIDSGDEAFADLLAGYFYDDGSLNWKEALLVGDNCFSRSAARVASTVLAVIVRKRRLGFHAAGLVIYSINGSRLGLHPVGGEFGSPEAGNLLRFSYPCQAISRKPNGIS